MRTPSALPAGMGDHRKPRWVLTGWSRPAAALMFEGSDQASSGCDGRHDMGTVTTTDGTEIFYKDWGSGQPIVFSHGWPLSADDWDNQMLFFLGQGYPVIAADRRGPGRSPPAGDRAA